jgi:hypothetical protein
VPAFEVYSVNNASKRIGASVYVNARDRRHAEWAGKSWLCLMGRRARHVRVEIYRPELDPAMRMYIRKNPISSTGDQRASLPDKSQV